MRATARGAPPLSHNSPLTSHRNVTHIVLLGFFYNNAFPRGREARARKQTKKYRTSIFARPCARSTPRISRKRGACRALRKLSDRQQKHRESSGYLNDCPLQIVGHVKRAESPNHFLDTLVQQLRYSGESDHSRSKAPSRLNVYPQRWKPVASRFEE